MKRRFFSLLSNLWNAKFESFFRDWDAFFYHQGDGYWISSISVSALVSSYFPGIHITCEVELIKSTTLFSNQVVYFHIDFNYLGILKRKVIFVQHNLICKWDYFERNIYIFLSSLLKCLSSFDPFSCIFFKIPETQKLIFFNCSYRYLYWFDMNLNR